MPSLRNDWAAYQFDQAVLYVGLVIENALHEREDFGPQNDRQSRPKYTIAQLLDSDFRLPLPSGSNSGLKAIAAANPGIFSRWKQVPKGA